MTVFAAVVIKDLDKDLQVGQFSAIFHYTVLDLEKVLIKTDGKYLDIPDLLSKTLLGISVSTLRGLMFGAFKGTFLHNAILQL